MKNSLPYKIITQVICVVLLVILVFPLYLMLEKSLAVSGFGNYAKVFEYFNLIPNVITSIIVVGGTLIVVSIVVSMAAYAFSKLEFPHKQAVYYLILTGMMIPTSALIFPLYQIVRGLHLNNTGWSLVFPYATASACFNLMVLTNYYNALPDELIDAAKIDGANKWQKIWHITIPALIPMITVMLLLSVGSIMKSDTGLFYQVTRNSGVLYPTTQVIDSYVLNAIFKNSNFGFTAATSFFQSVVGLLMMLFANGMVRKIAPDNALF